MTTFIQHKGKHALGRRRMEVRFEMGIDGLDDGMDVAAIRQAALELLQAYMDELTGAEWMSHTTILKRDPGQVKPSEGPFHAAARQKRPPRPKLEARDDVTLPEPTLKAAHRLVDAIFLLSVHGRAPTTGDIIKSRKIAAPTLYKLLDPEGEPWHYLERYVKVWTSKNKRLLDLTPEGRVLASCVRAGEVPA